MGMAWAQGAPSGHGWSSSDLTSQFEQIAGAVRQFVAETSGGGGPRRGGRGGGEHGHRGWGHGAPPWAAGWGGQGAWGAGGWGPFGGWPGGPGRRGPRVRGDVRLALIGLLAESPMHGYQLIQEIAARSDGHWRPSPGSVYPTLSQLEDEGLVRAEEEAGRRVFHLTETGQEQATQRQAEFQALWRQPADDPDLDGLRELGSLVVRVGAAAVQVASAGTPEQRELAAEVLERTRRDLYRLLADDEDRADGPSGEDER